MCVDEYNLMIHIIYKRDLINLIVSFLFPRTSLRRTWVDRWRLFTAKEIVGLAPRHGYLNFRTIRNAFAAAFRFVMISIFGTFVQFQVDRIVEVDHLICVVWQ